MAISWSQVVFILPLLGFGSAITDYYFDNKCDQTISIDGTGGQIESGTSAFNTDYSPNLDCTVTLTATAGHKILITWYKFQLEENTISGSCYDTMNIYSGTTATGTPLNTGKKCGDYYSSWTSDRYPSVESSSNSITFRLQTDSSGVYGQSFEFTYTSFTTGTCDPVLDHECDNGNCILMTLKDDFRDNCGDGSDEANWDDFAAAVGGLLALGLGILIAVIVGVVVGGILICVCCGCLCYHLCCKKQPANQVTVVHAAPPGLQGPGPV